jgi:hypothetical protein
MEIELREPFDGGPKPWTALIVAACIDAADLFVGWLPIGGEMFDLLQLGAALAVFVSPLSVLVGAADFLLVLGADVMPTYTIGVLASMAIGHVLGR